MAKSTPPDVLKLFQEAYSEPNGFKRREPDSEWFGLSCQVARVDDAWRVRIAWSGGAPSMSDAFEGVGETLEAAFAAALQKLISMEGSPPPPPTRAELEQEKFMEWIMEQRAEAEAKTAAEQPDAES